MVKTNVLVLIVYLGVIALKFLFVVDSRMCKLSQVSLEEKNRKLKIYFEREKGLSLVFRSPVIFDKIPLPIHPHTHCGQILYIF